MAVNAVFIDGAQHYLVNDKKWKNAVNAGETVLGVSGAHGRVNDDSAWPFRRHSFAAAVRASFRQRFIFRANAASNNDFIAAQSSTTNTHLTVRRNNDGTLSVVGPAGAWVHTTTATYALNTWFEIEFRCRIANGAGEYLLKVDGDVPARSGGGLLWEIGIDTQNASDAFLLAFYSGNSNLDTYGDDAVIAVGNNNLGLGEVETLYPVGPTSINELTRGGTDTLANFSQCNEALYDGDTTYVVSTANNQRDCYDFGEPTIEGDNLVVQVTATCVHDSSGDPDFRFQLFLRVDGDNYDGDTIHDAPLNYECFQEAWSLNPATNEPWAPEDFPIQAGIFCLDNGVRMTQLVLEIAALTPTPDPVVSGAGSRDYCGSVNEDLN